MNLLNIITTMFEYKYFPAIISITIGFLVIAFLVVLFAGLKDAKKKETKKIEIFEEKDITFEEPKEELIIQEEVTLEMPSLTKNLEDFKKAIEEEIKLENITPNIEVEQNTNKSLIDSTKPFRILNVNEIEDTIITEVISTNDTNQSKVEIEENYETEEVTEHEIKIIDPAIKEDAIITVQKLDIPLLAPDEDDELLFKTMTALQLPRDI